MLINEVKFTDLNKQDKTKTIGDIQKAAHSQGYDVSDPKMKSNQGDHYEVELTHRKTGQKVKNTRGGSFGDSVKGKSPSRKSEAGNTIRNQVAQSIRADATSRGRVDKRPKAKAERKAQAAMNKKRKMNDRDPFKRGKTFEEFLNKCNNLLT